MIWGLMWYWWLTGAAAILITIFAISSPAILRWWQARESRQALATFRVRRERLELQFFELARVSGTPRGVTWSEIDWLETVTFARDKSSGLLTAFAGINVSFEAVAGGEMEDVEHVGLLRDAVAIFHFRNGKWGTGGRALFNMNPSEALNHLTLQYEPLENISG